MIDLNDLYDDLMDYMDDFDDHDDIEADVLDAPETFEDEYDAEEFEDEYDASEFDVSDSACVDDDFGDLDDDNWDDILFDDSQEGSEDDEWELEAYDDAEWEDYDAEVFDAPNYMNFNLEEADLEHVIGNVEEDMNNWHVQEGPTCAVCAQEFVLEALTGQEYDMDQLRELAEENGWYTNGTPMYDVGNLLKYHGLEVHKYTNGTIESIENCLEQGGKVIVGVDSDEIWEGVNEEMYMPGTDADHAVQVVGFDYSDPNNPMVILNDSGPTNGCGAMVSMENFKGAWEDSGCFMVTAYGEE